MRVHDVAVAHNHVVGLQGGEEEEQRREKHTGSIARDIMVIVAMIATKMPISPGATDLTEPVQALLTSLPDPASAMRFLGRLRQESPAGFARICSRGHAAGVDGAALRCALHIFSYSNFLSEACLKNPDALWEASRPGTLDRLCSRDDYRQQLERSPRL